MRNSGRSTQRRLPNPVSARKSLVTFFTLCAFSSALVAQSAPVTPQVGADDLAARIQDLNAAVDRAQAGLEESQRQLQDLRRQISALEGQLAQSTHNTAPDPPPGTTSAEQSTAPNTTTDQTIQTIRDNQAVHDSQIATLDQTKVETASKYPFKITGMLLMNGFVNTRAVDVPATPTFALDGPGNSGASIRQSILGFDAHGPHLWGASSSADLRVDFAGTPQFAANTSTPTYGYAVTEAVPRLRTAHARLDWNNTEGYFALDRPVFSPDAPASLTAVAEAALAWSGNLWMWNPEVGLTQDIPSGHSTTLRLQSALIDVADAPLTPVNGAATSAENSRWPGVQARIALLGSNTTEDANHFGIGGYFAPHLSPFGRRYDAWAATLDTHLHIVGGLSLTGSAYRGLALGGLGGGVFKDIVYKPAPGGVGYYSRPLDAVGGWIQLQEKVSERLQFNAAFGTDQGFAYELNRYALPTNSDLENLARNSTWTGNFIYSPSSWLLFSAEYRYVKSALALGPAYDSNIIGAAAGYRF